MTDGHTAAARLERLLHVLPAAMRPGGAPLDDLAASLGTSAERIVEDLQELTARVFYRPGGWPDDIQILLENDRVEVLRGDGFERPVRLNRDETLCLALALRGAAASAHLEEEDARHALLERAESHLGRPLEDGDPGAESIHTPDREPDVDGVREILIAARTARRPCAIWYARPGDEHGSVRVVHPWAVCYAEGSWYTVAWCTRAETVRVFRLDRVLACDMTDGAFEVPEDFDVESVLKDGRVFFARGDQSLLDVRVRYSAAIARWVRERAQWKPGRLEEGEDGTVYVRHAVADPQWVVSHALQYGGEAEIEAPPEVRGLVLDAVRDLAG